MSESTSQSQAQQAGITVSILRQSNGFSPAMTRLKRGGPMQQSQDQLLLQGLRNEFNASPVGTESDCCRALDVFSEAGATDKLWSPATNRTIDVAKDLHEESKATVQSSSSTRPDEGKTVSTYEQYLRQKLERKKGCRETLNELVQREPAVQRKRLLQQRSTGSLEESRTSVKSGTRPPVFIKQVQESLDRIQLDSSRVSSNERQSKQKASAVELQHQLNELLAGIVSNFSKKKSSNPTDLFSQLKQSVKELQFKTKSLQEQVTDRDALLREKDRQIRDQRAKIDMVEFELSNTACKHHNEITDKDAVIIKLRDELATERKMKAQLFEKAQKLATKLEEGKAKYDEKCLQVKALKRSQRHLGQQVEAIAASAFQANR